MFQSNDERAMLLRAQSPSVAILDEVSAEGDSDPAYVQPGERLPFRVRVARTENQLRKAIKVRAEAYGRHTPSFAETLRSVEQDDIERSSVVLLCESKLTGDAIGTLRIHTNFDAPTYLERVIALPPFLRNTGIAYVTRLAVTNGSNGATVKLALFKALYRYCFATQIEWMLAVARDPVDRDLGRLGFQDILPPGQKLSRPQDFGDVQVRPLYFSVRDTEHRWRSSGHRLYDFMFRTLHPDIEIFSSVSGAWATPRRLNKDRGASVPALDGTAAQIMAV